MGKRRAVIQGSGNRLMTSEERHERVLALAQPELERLLSLGRTACEESGTSAFRGNPPLRWDRDAKFCQARRGRHRVVPSPDQVPHEVPI